MSIKCEVFINILIIKIGLIGRDFFPNPTLVRVLKELMSWDSLILFGSLLNNFLPQYVKPVHIVICFSNTLI